MNEHVKAVDAMDRRHRVKIRIASFVSGALLVGCALWTAGVSPGLLIEQIHSWFKASDQEQVADVNKPSSLPLPTKNAPATPPTVPSGTDSSISAVPLPLYLVSTAPGRNLREGTARLGSNPEFPLTVVAGAILANGARLVEIHQDHVVLERNQQRLNLFLSAEKNKALARRGKGALDLAMVGGSKASPPAPAIEPRPALTDVIRSQARYENDRVVGLEVFPGQKTHIYSQLGLKPGDLVVAIDGVPITDAVAATQYLQGLIGGSALSVTIVRAGQRSTLSLDGALVAKAYEKPEGHSMPIPPMS